MTFGIFPICQLQEPAAREDDDPEVQLGGAGGGELEALEARAGQSPSKKSKNAIAALNGTVAGGAMGMVLACDIRLAVPHARAFYPVMRLGFLPQPSDPARLAVLIGPARAALILMAGARLTAEEALVFGLFDRIMPEAEVLSAAQALAADALAASPAHLAAIKTMIPRA